MKTETGGARMICNTQDMWRSRKLAEQAELQQAIIELQNQILTNLQRLNVNRHNHHRALSTGAGIPSPIHSPSFFDQTPVPPFDRPSREVIEENGSNPPTAVHATTVADRESEPIVNASAKERELTTTNCTDENGNGKESPHQQEESDLPERYRELSIF